MVKAYSEFGATARVPTLFVFARNDSRYTVATIEASVAAYRTAGARAVLALKNAHGADGHQIHVDGMAWAFDAQEFLRANGFADVGKHYLTPVASTSATTSPASPTQAQ